VLRGELEIRWERGTGTGTGTTAGAQSDGAARSSRGEGAGDGRPGLWWQGQPLPSWTPDAEAADGAFLERW
jgi:hypothetical protein